MDTIDSLLSNSASKDTTSKKMVKITELNYDENVEDADVAIRLAAVDECPKHAKDVNPTQVLNDGFVEVTRKNDKGKHTSKSRHIDGVRLTKPKLNYYYRPISKKATTQPNKKGKDVSLHNSFDELIEEGKIFEVNNKTWKASNDVMDDSNSEEVKNVFVEDNGKPMDSLVDDARKKVGAPPKKTPMKTCIWSGRKVDSPIRNVVFSPKMKVHYFDRDDIEEVEHENA
ncbi:hypothetical protein Tco_0736817 [Tanacetum coccineum]